LGLLLGEQFIHLFGSVGSVTISFFWLAVGLSMLFYAKFTHYYFYLTARIKSFWPFKAKEAITKPPEVSLTTAPLSQKQGLTARDGDAPFPFAEPWFVPPAEPIPSATFHPMEPPSTSEQLSIPYTPPPLSVLLKTEAPTAAQSKSHLIEVDGMSKILAKTLADFGVDGQILGHQSGPVVSVIEFQTEPGTKQSKVMGLADDLALALKVDSILIQPLKNKSALGIQVPHSQREKVYLGDIINQRIFAESPSPLTFGLGKTIHGEPTVADLSSMPHLLIAGSTGSGKSVGVNGMLCSIIMKSPPERVKMILVDPKMLELSVYEGIPHLLMPVITDPHKASLALKWTTLEMERRYKIMQLCSVRNIDGFNDLWPRMSREKQTSIIQTLKEEHQILFEEEALGPLPFLMIVIDELADLMITAPKDVEVSIQRLAQKARASGIHMVLATQRPSVDIITGVIKANLPCRIAYQVVSKHDSRTILDMVGAEKLLGRGDLLFQKPGSSRLERLQGALITDEEVINLVEQLKIGGQKPQYDESAIQWIEENHASQHTDGEGAASDTPSQDSKYPEAMQLARSTGTVSASFLQRHLKVGYNRAARMVEAMEKQGLVEKADGVKPRKWLA
jgi:S-DNA-T family DNA segregation ATPase FtsK/SpoIIIE